MKASILILGTDSETDSENSYSDWDNYEGKENKMKQMKTLQVIMFQPMKKWK